jgi:4-coumarate--CoA ligase
MQNVLIPMDYIDYGCTELSSCVSQSGVRDEGAPLVATGTIVTNIKIRFINEQEEDVYPPESGEICVSSPTIMMYVLILI